MSKTFYFHSVGGLKKAYAVWEDPLGETDGMCCVRKATWVCKYPRQSGTYAEPKDGTNIEVYLLCDQCKIENSHYNSPNIIAIPIRSKPKALTIEVISVGRRRGSKGVAKVR